MVYNSAKQQVWEYLTCLHLAAHTAVQRIFNSLRGQSKKMSWMRGKCSINRHQKENEKNAENTYTVLLEQ